MKCPDCGTKLSTKHYDATYEWYECPKCEGCFTYDEIIEGGIDESGESEEAEGKGNRKGAQGKKAAGGRGKKRTNAGRKNGSVQAADDEIRERVRSVPIAKGKKRRTEIEEDEQAVEDYTKSIVENTVKQERVPHHRDEVETVVLLSAWQDEIQAVYEDLGFEIDELNARDKATILWREVHHKHGASARAQAVPHAACKEHE